MRIEIEMIQVQEGNINRFEGWGKNKHTKQPNSHLNGSIFQLPKPHNYFRSTQKTSKKTEITKLQRNRKRD